MKTYSNRANILSEEKPKILAKLSGITLEEHTSNVVCEGEAIVSKLPATKEKYYSFSGKDLSRRLELACRHHDDGKREKCWQQACQRDYNNFILWSQERSNGSFSQYQLERGTEVGKNLRIAGVRHEISSIKYVQKKYPLWLKVAIGAHHGKLGFRYEERWKQEAGKELWTEFLKGSNNISELENTERSAIEHYCYAGPRGLLRFADHRASAKEEGLEVVDISSFQYSFPPNWEKRTVQKLVEANWKKDFLLVRAPTGAGKTDAALLWASKQIENKRADRLVIAMPTRFTSNALAINISKTLSDIGLYHSTSWYVKHQSAIEIEYSNVQKERMTHQLARYLATPITVCTIDHLLMALTLSREDHHLITFNLANSCLVIDEVDFYDDFTQANIRVLLELLGYWKVPVLMMSASLPDSTLSEYRELGYSNAELIEDISDYERIRFSIKDIQESEGLENIENTLQIALEKKTAIIYANTVDRAMIYYDWFRNRGIGVEDIVLYHSRFSEPDKKKKEELLIEMLGRNAWEKGKAKGIAVLTQIGEMSINISSDIMISDICPIDRLTQRAGRLCRFDNNKRGELYIILPQKNGCMYPAPYGSYDNKTKSWKACNALTSTIDLISKDCYSAQMLIDLVNKVYLKERQYSFEAQDNARRLRNSFRDNWIVNPKNNPEEEDTNNDFWKSRDIAQQETIYIERPCKTYFSSRAEFEIWKLAYTVDIPIYLLEKGLKNHMIIQEGIIVGEQEMSLFIVNTGFYSFERGVDLKESDIFL
ncbi:MAG: CRISPR-associated helicase Cas3' [Porphyromonas sp.]|nr:CRISPR-associated helicase Cas3' [Porphyromonas sp.]